MQGARWLGPTLGNQFNCHLQLKIAKRARHSEKESYRGWRKEESSPAPGK